MQYLLDSDTCIAVLRNEPRVVTELSARTPSDCAISTIAAYELHTGVEKCADPPRERTKVETLLTTLQVLSFDLAAGEAAARVRAKLEATGQPIGPYDTLLAGHALSLGLKLVTSNTSEFGRVAGLVIEDWRS